MLTHNPYFQYKVEEKQMELKLKYGLSNMLKSIQNANLHIALNYDYDIYCAFLY